MRAGRRSVALVALGLLPIACAVYNDESLSPEGGDDPSAGAGNLAGHAGSSGNSSLGGSSTAIGGTTGKTQAGAGGTAGSAFGGSANSGTGGKGLADGGDAAGGDSDMPNGGTPNGGGGTTAGHGGVAAGAGAGGMAGAGGKGGTGGVANGGGGAGGSGGKPSGPLCSDHPLTARSSWVASASHFDATNSGVAANVLDNTKTRWSTGKAQSGNEWLQIDFGSSVTINHVNLQQGDDINDYPRTYAVIVSDTAKDVNATPKLTGSGKSGVSTAILLPALATGRYLLIKQTGTSLSWWSAEELEVSCAE
jgi:hypothetical protein